MTDSRNKIAGALVLAALLLICCVAAYIFVSNGGEEGETPDEVTAYIMCQEFVRDRLKAPASAEFPRYTRADIVNTENRWKVEGWVDAENSFGARVRTSYYCILTYSAGDQSWTLETLEFE